MGRGTHQGSATQLDNSVISTEKPNTLPTLSSYSLYPPKFRHPSFKVNESLHAGADTCSTVIPSWLHEGCSAAANTSV